MIWEPGNSVATISNLINENNGADNALVTDQLLMAIFWEESLFNNIKQPDGTAIGFGQVEPAELKRMNRMGQIQVDVNSILRDPATSVDAAAQMLDALFSKLGKTEALRGYAGYYFKADPQHRGKRQATINGWVACESVLLGIGQNILDLVSDSDGTMGALKHSRGFHPEAVTSKGVTWRDTLFPNP